MTVCGDRAAQCVCGLRPGHESPHRCLAATIYDGEECGGAWTRDPFTVRAWPAAARHDPVVAARLPPLPFVDHDMDRPAFTARRGRIAFFPPPALGIEDWPS